MKNSRLEKLHLYICLAAAFIVTVICILRNETLYRTSIAVCLTIVAFYVLGQVVRIYLSNTVFFEAEEEESEEGEDLEEGEEGEDSALQEDADEALEDMENMEEELSTENGYIEP